MARLRERAFAFCDTAPMRFQLSAVAEATGGELIGADAWVSGASIDSRQVRPGELFVPISADRDGHDFIAAAVAAGAGGYLTSGPTNASSAVLVRDTLEALQALGVAARNRMEGQVVGITGSVGKTTTKDLLRAAAATTRVTYASPLSFNNELGVPLTLVGSPDDVEVVICEMGARGRGHIATLCEVARPTVGVVLSVGAAHTEQFGDLDGVAQAKGELPASLPDSGTAVLNAADPRVLAMSGRTNAAVITFGESGDVVAEEISLDSMLRPRFQLLSPWGKAECNLRSAGLHSVTNALAALTAAMVLGVDIQDAVSGVGSAEISPWRMDVTTMPAGAVVINDSYNANPLSMHAAIDALLTLPARRRFAVVGVMAELGDRHQAEHRLVTERLLAEGIRIIAVAAPEYGGLQVGSGCARRPRRGRRRVDQGQQSGRPRRDRGTAHSLTSLATSPSAVGSSAGMSGEFVRW